MWLLTGSAPPILFLSLQRAIVFKKDLRYFLFLTGTTQPNRSKKRLGFPVALAFTQLRSLFFAETFINSPPPPPQVVRLYFNIIYSRQPFAWRWWGGWGCEYSRCSWPLSRSVPSDGAQGWGLDGESGMRCVPIPQIRLFCFSAQTSKQRMTASENDWQTDCMINWLTDHTRQVPMTFAYGSYIKTEINRLCKQSWDFGFLKAQTFFAPGTLEIWSN